MKKILFLTYRIPDISLKDGYSIRVLGLARILKREYQVDLVSLFRKELAEEYKESLKEIFNNLFLFPKNIFSEKIGAIKGILKSSPIQENIYFSLEMCNWINKNYRNYNLIFCETLRTVKCIENLKIPKVIDLIESLSLKYKRALQFVNPSWKLIYQIEIPRVEEKEREVLKKLDKVFISSPFDKKYLIENSKLKTQESRITVIPNGIKEELIQHPTSNIQYPEENFISFFGKMDYQPNEDAVLWFLKEVFSRIQNKTPRLKFYIIGTNPTEKIKRLEDNNIKVTGYLKNPYEILQKSKLIVVPLRFGAGIQNKVLESMALGKAIITSPIGAQGIPEANPGEHFEVIETNKPEIWVKKIQELSYDSQKRSNLGRKAKLLIEENYRWEKIGDKLLEIINELTG